MDQGCGECGTPLRRAIDDHNRCPKCENEMFVGYDKQKEAERKEKELKKKKSQLSVSKKNDDSGD